MINRAAMLTGTIGIMTAVAVPFISFSVDGTPDTGYSAVALQAGAENGGPAQGSDQVRTPRNDGPDGWVWD